MSKFEIGDKVAITIIGKNGTVAKVDFGQYYIQADDGFTYVAAERDLYHLVPLAEDYGREPSRMLRYHFQSGDTVLVVCKERGRAHNWSNTWASEMDKLVGNVYEVEADMGDVGIKLRTTGHFGMIMNYSVPWWCLDRTVSSIPTAKPFASAPTYSIDDLIDNPTVTEDQAPEHMYYSPTHEIIGQRPGESDKAYLRRILGG